MIAVIGFEDDVVTLGLSGVSEIVEVTASCNHENLISHVLQICKSGAKTVFMSQKLLEMLSAKEKQGFGIYFIEIPCEFQNIGLEKIDALARETLGISLDKN
ncbi:hypothetical protein HOC01_02260 [archaeon]|jgi:vacuolar-type H+-ATPase subunit F/Vma7|nr:hypothetical protein [archaeon]MBT6697858.1 hypothetical protein [archaeon]